MAEQANAEQETLAAKQNTSIDQVAAASEVNDDQALDTPIENHEASTAVTKI